MFLKVFLPQLTSTNIIPAQISALRVSFIIIKNAFKIEEGRFVEILRDRERSLH